MSEDIPDSPSSFIANPIYLSSDDLTVTTNDKTVDSSSSKQPTTPQYVTLDVLSLKYYPGKDIYHESKNFLISKLNLHKFSRITTQPLGKRVAPLQGVSFRASAGKITAILSNDMPEVSTLMDLIVGRRKTGSYSGDIALSGLQALSKSPNSVKYSRNVAFVPHKTLYIPSLTYLETLRYAARLQLADQGFTSQAVEGRVQEVLTIMDLQRVKNRVIPYFPESRGELGRDIRLLGIALEILSFPALIVIDDPVLLLDAGVAVKIFQRLQELASRGHIILCGMPKPNPSIVPYLDNIVLLSEGYSIYSSTPRNVEKYFTSSKLSYIYRNDVDIVDFMLDIALGTERPQSSRVPEPSLSLQEKYEQSPFFEAPIINVNSLSVFNSDFVRYYGYTRFDRPITLLKRTWVIIDRAFVSKIKDTETIKRSLGGSLILSCAIGYLQLSQGSYGYYSITLLKYPYLGTANITALLFFVNGFSFVQQVLNVHVICQKVQVFKYEQSSKYATSLSFTLATILSEVPFTVFYIWVFATILYFLADLNKGFSNYIFFVVVLCMIGVIGLGTALMFSSIFTKEIRVRDIYLMSTFLMVLLSGFPFQIPGITSYMNQISQINPFRWSFEAMLAWKFNYYLDGYYYLLGFGAQRFDHTKIYEILTNFIVISWSVFFVTTIPFPVLLKREESVELTNRLSSNRISSNVLLLNKSQSTDLDRAEATDKFDHEFLPKKLSVRNSELQKPLIFARESSISSKAKLSLSITPFGEDTSSLHGPTVTFSGLTYKVKDRQSPLGFKTILNNLTGQFDWGKLSMILGGSQSGKSSLLHILAGDVGLQSDINGDIAYNGQPVKSSIPLWQRCALVEAHDEQYRDLSVRDVITFAMKLRCVTEATEKLIDVNVKLTVELLHLDSILHKKVKTLTRGERRRVSIAEEIVHGPSLVFIDEPITNLEIHDEAIMLTTFREMVNQDKTVVVTTYQPSSASFKLFDEVTLLSKGRIIYSGPTNNASSYFISCPANFDFSGYVNNPGDFLIDISTGQLVDYNETHVEAPQLEEWYQSSEGYRDLLSRVAKQKSKAQQPSASGSYRVEGASQSSKGVTTESINPIIAESPERSSFDVESKDQSDPVNNNQTNVVITKSVAYRPLVVLACGQLFSECFSCRNWNVIQSLKIARVILHRSSLGLINRWKLVSSAIVIYILLACLFGWIIGDASDQVYNATSFFAVSPLLLFICNVMYIFYISKSNEVFLKEHSRGLYTNVLHWLVSSIPLYSFQVFNSIVYSLITYSLLNFNTDSSIYRYFFASNVVAVLGSFLMTEFVVLTVADIRSGYLLTPGLILVQFAFSGLFIKQGSLPAWLSAWALDASMIRWCMEGQFVNQFENSSVFPVVNGFSTYQSFLQIFSWNESRYTCLYNLFYFIIIFKFGSLIANGLISSYQRGGRSFKRIQEDDPIIL